MTKNHKFVISGYYGHDNFGDDAILNAIVSEIKENFEMPVITVISNNPEKTKLIYQVDSVYKYDLPSILKEILACNIFISGGGSLFQDATSLKSLVYYLSLLLAAKFFNKKIFVYAQGIGPLKSLLSRLLTAFVIKKADFVTVRDNKSAEILSSLKIKSTVTTDPVWGLEDFSNKEDFNENKIKIGVQLRNWRSLDESRLNLIADAISSNFQDVNTEIYLLPLQPSEDLEIMNRFSSILKGKNGNQKVKLLSSLTLKETIFYIAGFDMMIAMRYHAGLVAAKYSVPFLALEYDPKVKNLAEELGIPCICFEGMTFDLLNKQIKHLIAQKDQIKSALEKISAKKYKTAKETIFYLTRIAN
ncbi:MAG TPA: polysaccharide pyruvyl transferase CsaB [Candidatus Gastranaerophilales bacterium]|nr:polysaccharide pyruvyl transferase CsaB [Candidatus Gastranaerophilales bacterium]